MLNEKPENKTEKLDASALEVVNHLNEAVREGFGKMTVAQYRDMLLDSEAARDKFRYHSF